MFVETLTPACTLALPWPLWYLGACRMLSYPPHPAHQHHQQQQQATASMSLACPGQTQNHQQQQQHQQQQSRDEQSIDKTPAADDDELQKPVKVQLHYIFSAFLLSAIILFKQVIITSISNSCIIRMQQASVLPQITVFLKVLILLSKVYIE